MRTGLLKIASCLAGLWLLATPAGAQVGGAAIDPDEANRERINKWTVGLVGGTIDAAYIKFSADIARVLDDGDNMRVLAILTKGAVQNIYDLLYLKGIDVGMVGADTFAKFKKEGTIRNLEDRIQFISQVHISTMQILAGPEIKTLKDLEGKKVAVPAKGATATLLVQKILDKHGVKAELVDIGISAGVVKVQSGEVAAVGGGLTAGGPTAYSELPKDRGLHILDVDFSKFLDEYYVPVTLTSEDYPNLIQPGEQVKTIGTPVVLAVYNWPSGTDRFRKVARFIDYYFERLEQFKKPPYEPQWKSVNVAADVPGWKRYWYAQQVLDKYVAAKPSNVKLTAQDQETLSGLQGEEQRRQFKEFLEWKKAQTR